MRHALRFMPGGFRVHTGYDNGSIQTPVSLKHNLRSNDLLQDEIRASPHRGRTISGHAGCVIPHHMGPAVLLRRSLPAHPSQPL